MSFLNLFRSKKLREPIDLGRIGCDMHSHLIPGIDDGAKTMDDALELVERMHQLGYRKLITTPHIQHDYFQNTPEIIHNGLMHLQEKVEKNGWDIQIEAAAEYLIDDDFLNKLKKGILMTLGDNYLLVEFSYYTPHPQWRDIIFDIQTAGYKVILAHPERYSYWHEQPEIYQELFDRGVFLQLNAISLTSYYSEEVRKIAETLVNKQFIRFVGSDMHNNHYMNALERVRNRPMLKKLIDSDLLMNKKLL